MYLKKIVTAIVRAVKRGAYIFLKKHLIYIAENTVDKKSFALVGSLHSMPRYKRLYLSTRDGVKVNRKVRLISRLTIERMRNEHGLVVVGHDSPLNDVLIVPDFVDLSIKLPVDITAYKKQLPNTARYDIRKVERNGLRSRVSNDISQLPIFYKQYYLPSMQSRHGDEAYIMPEAEMTSLFLKGNYEFLNVYCDDYCVSMVLTELKDSKYHFFKVGWLNGDSALVGKGAVAAMYWFSIQRAFTLKCTELVLGGSPAYLESGVFKYKAKWLATVTGEAYSLNQLLLNPDVADCYQFLKHISLIAFKQK
jgi:hypothetical protein